MARWFRIIMSTGLLCVVVFGNDADAATAAQSGVPGVWRQLVGPAEGTQVADFDPSCPPTGPFNSRLRHQFDVTVAGGPATGEVLIQVDMCVSVVGQVVSYDGTFEIHTRVGDVSGRASGSITEVIPPDVRTVFTLTPTSGTGALGHNFVPLTLELVNSPGPGVIAPADGTLSVGTP
jgi:hypothetical protein